MDVETRLRLLEGDMDTYEGHVEAIKAGLSKLTLSILGLLTAIVVCTVSVLLTFAASR